MDNKIIRELDNQGRLLLGTQLLKLCRLEKRTNVAICALSDNQIVIRNMDELKGYKFLCLVRLDNKARIIIPVKIRKQTQKFELYVQDENLILEEAQ